MIRGLQITITGEELSRRISERIRMHEETISALDTRIKQREGDQPFDVRAEDGFQTLGELETERQRYLDRVTQLTLLHNNVATGERYALSRADLRIAELISPENSDAAEIADHQFVTEVENAPIDGLKLTISGEELRTLLEQGIGHHRRCAERWKREQERTSEDETEDEPLLPDHMCANEEERHKWHADLLAFIRDHVDSAKTYRLGEADLAFGELLPQKPGWMEQEEYEERTRIGFNLELLTKRIGGVVPRALAFNPELIDGNSRP